MSNRWYISDTHFSHRNIIRFIKEDGTKLRNFSTLQEMDDLMIENWNKVVRPKDTIVHLGDVVINRKALQILENLNGRKILIRGNHDIFRTKEYLKFFEEIRGGEVKPGVKIIFSHYPIHPSSLKEGWINVHGHIHDKNVLLENREIDYRFFNLSIEKMDYKPIEWNELLKLIEINREKAYENTTANEVSN